VKSDIWRASILALVMVGASALAIAITPRQYMGDIYVRQKLAQIVPGKFADWEIDRSIVPVPPSPELQQTLDETYDETLALTYRNREGQRVMLSLAYGRNQHKGMNTHRPEICYPGQGFKVVSPSVEGSVAVQGRNITVRRLVAAMGSRNEPITYWLLVGEHITQFGFQQRLTAIKYGLSGEVPDGVLVRVSSIDRDNAEAFKLQERFIQDLLQAISPDQRQRLLGST
jgi:EpsI family protein